MIAAALCLMVVTTLTIAAALWSECLDERSRGVVEDLDPAASTMRGVVLDRRGRPSVRYQTGNRT